MSSEIYYDKAFIKVGEDYIPIVNQGSSNCFEVNWNGREIPEKNWHVLFLRSKNYYRNRTKVIYTKSEVEAIAEDYGQIAEENGGGVKRTRYTAFSGDEFKRWIISGMKNAYTVEEYTAYGNKVLVCDNSVWDKPGIHTVKTTEELFEALKLISEAKCIEVTFDNNREVYRPKRQKAESMRIDYASLPCFYVLSDTKTYFSKLKQYSITATPYATCASSKKFRTEKEAGRYLARHGDRIKPYGYSVMRIDNEPAG